MGLSSPRQLDATLAALAAELPEELCTDLAELLPERSLWRDGTPA